MQYFQYFKVENFSLEINDFERSAIWVDYKCEKIFAHMEVGRHKNKSNSTADNSDACIRLGMTNNKPD